MVNVVEGNHDTIPIPKTFHNPLPLPGNATPLKAKHYTLQALGRTHRQGQLHLLLILPNESRSLIPADWTDWPITLSPHSEKLQPDNASTLAHLSDLLHACNVVDALQQRIVTSEESHCAATAPDVPRHPRPSRCRMGTTGQRTTRRRR
jgi:hypothetical protein